ncbi:unnamed protein product, partial [Nesidiocoris tenuis]
WDCLPEQTQSCQELRLRRRLIENRGSLYVVRLCDQQQPSSKINSFRRQAITMGLSQEFLVARTTAKQGTRGRAGQPVIFGRKSATWPIVNYKRSAPAISPDVSRALSPAWSSSGAILYAASTRRYKANFTVLKLEAIPELCLDHVHLNGRSAECLCPKRFCRMMDIYYVPPHLSTHSRAEPTANFYALLWPSEDLSRKNLSRA